MNQSTPGAFSPPPPTSGAAIAAMVLGIMSFMLCLFTAIPAVICGFVALSSIKESRGALGGRGLAITGLATGGLSILVFLVLFIPALLLPVFIGRQVQRQSIQLQSATQTVESAVSMPPVEAPTPEPPVEAVPK